MPPPGPGRLPRTTGHHGTYCEKKECEDCGTTTCNAGTPSSGPVPPPTQGLHLRTIGHHPDVCGKDCTECHPTGSAEAGRNSSASLPPDLRVMALSKGQYPLDPESSDPLSKWTCKHGTCLLPNPTGRHNAYTWNGLSREYGNGRFSVCKACYVEQNPSDPDEKNRLMLSGSF